VIFVPDKRQNFFIFALFNLAFFVLAGVFLVAPAVNSLRSGRENTRLLERRYAAERLLYEEYESNRQELAKIRESGKILSHDEMIKTLAEIAELGETFGLVNTDFFASEVTGNVIGAAGTSRLFEMRVRTEHEGAFYNLQGFFYEFLGGYGQTRSFSISEITEETARLRLDFSLYGSDLQ
jgi:hypothetical protein